MFYFPHSSRRTEITVIDGEAPPLKERA